jgi:hypothetical protein
MLSLPLLQRGARDGAEVTGRRRKIAICGVQDLLQRDDIAAAITKLKRVARRRACLFDRKRKKGRENKGRER